MVVQNGEIYNYRELRADLARKGHSLPHAGRHRGASRTSTRSTAPRFAEHLRGMFAVAVWDAKRRRLVLARDRFGIKPLYYRVTGESLSFASELKALLRQPDFSREIDPDAVEAFLAFSFVPAPLSIFREARKLPPGQRARLGSRRGLRACGSSATRAHARRGGRPCAARARRSSRRSCSSGCATRSGPT